MLRRFTAAAFAVLACLTSAALTAPAAHAGGPYYVECPIDSPPECGRLGG